MKILFNFHFAILILSTLLFLVSCRRDEKCGRNEEYIHCIKFDCDGEPTCDVPEPKCTPKRTYDCRNKCACKAGFVRNETNDCINLEDCKKKKKKLSREDKCGKNEEYKKCGKACESTCVQPDPESCDKPCEDRCFCKKGFLRNGRGRCVKPSRCRGEEENKLQCGDNEEFEKCGKKCEPTCEMPNPKRCGIGCEKKCFCKVKYLRNNENKCVRPKQCEDDNF